MQEEYSSGLRSFKHEPCESSGKYSSSGECHHGPPHRSIDPLELRNPLLWLMLKVSGEAVLTRRGGGGQGANQVAIEPRFSRDSWELLKQKNYTGAKPSPKLDAPMSARWIEGSTKVSLLCGGARLPH